MSSTLLPPDMARRRALLLSIPSAVLTACIATPAQAGYNIWTNEYSIPQADLQAQVETRFPLRLQYAQLFEVRVSRPRLGLDAARGRVAITVDVNVSSPFASQPLSGVLTISSKLRFDAATLSVRLLDPATDRMDLKGLSATDAAQLQAVGQLIAQEALQDYPVHTFKPEELKYGNRRFEPGEISVADGALVVKLN